MICMNVISDIVLDTEPKLEPFGKFGQIQFGS